MTATINELTRRAHLGASANGFWDGQDPHDPTVILAKLMLICSEAAEAAEVVRSINIAPTETLYDDNGKPEGLPSELADIVIRVADLAGALDINLQAAIANKLIHNEARPYRHGKRA